MINIAENDLVKHLACPNIIAMQFVWSRFAKTQIQFNIVLLRALVLWESALLQ